jgi:hypothetical protein
MHFHAIRRSFDAYAALLDLGAPAIPRVGFVDTRDVERQAAWCNANTSVATVSVDLMTLHQATEWQENAALLEMFDQLTNQRLTYIADGVRRPSRVRHLAELLGDRVVVSEATIARPAAKPFIPPTQPEPLRSEWERRIHLQDEVVIRAHQQAQRHRQTSIGGSRAAA